MSTQDNSFVVATVTIAAAALALGYYIGVTREAATAASATSAPLTAASATAATATAELCTCGAVLAGFSESARSNHVASARHRRNMRLIARSAALVVAENWSEYRSCIPYCISSTDTVLEVGCGNGVTTSLLSQTCSRAVGVDMSEALITEARERFPALEWHAMDARLAGPLSKLATFDAIFIDLNGSRETEVLLSLVDAYEAVLKPALIVVKSNKLKHLISKCSSVDQLISQGRARRLESPAPHAARALPCAIGAVRRNPQYRK